jgi:hypothetical protein
MSGAVPPLPNTPSGRGAQLKHRGFTVPFILWNFIYRFFVSSFLNMTSDIQNN